MGCDRTSILTDTESSHAIERIFTESLSRLIAVKASSISFDYRFGSDLHQIDPDSLHRAAGLDIRRYLVMFFVDLTFCRDQRSEVSQGFAD
jgi:hypothetical protein